MASTLADPEADGDGATVAVELALGLELGDAGGLPHAATMSAATAARAIDR